VVDGRIRSSPGDLSSPWLLRRLPAEKKERFEAIGRNASEDLQGLKISSRALFARNVKLVFHYFRNMLVGMGLYRKGPSGIVRAIKYTYSFASYGLRQYVRLGQI
jgi:hypothetical protein